MKKSFKISETKFCNIISNMVRQTLNEAKEEEAYTHFAVNKFTNLIVNGWDYSGYEYEDLKRNKRDYFSVDLEEMGFNPSVYKILSRKSLSIQGIDDDMMTGWSNTGVWPLNHENRMQSNGIDYRSKAREEHPDWFVD